ncbi:hypothetical protein ACP275_13G134000 [Erythranthe tilingii]
MNSKTMIYGLKSNSWREIEDFPYPLPFLKGHWRAFVSGAMHTLVEEYDRGYRARIMAFSVESEKHYEVAMPPGFRTRIFELNLDSIEGRLCLVCTNRSRAVIWVMNEYGVKESWTKLVSICPPLIEEGDFVKPLAYSGERDKILLNCEDKRLFWYDLRKKSVEDVLVDGMPFVFYAEPCVESLVSPDGPRTVKKLGREKIKGKKIRNKR